MDRGKAVGEDTNNQRWTREQATPNRAAATAIALQRGKSSQMG